MTTHHHHSPGCQALLSRLGDYIDGELEAALCAQIEQHLAGCNDCRVLVDTTRKTIRLYRRHNRETAVELPAHVAGRLWQALKNQGCIPESD